MNGIFAVHKPKGITSHDVVNRVRKITGVKRVGHGGTLDPLASGVLIIAVGRENTKLLDTFVKGEKEYVATIKLGYESTTDDEEGEKVIINNKQIPTKKQIERVLNKFTGKILQIPPQYSAIKIQGQTAYKAARKGQTLDLKARTVEIKQIEILDYSYPFLKMSVITGPGVYIRSLARDLGQALGTGGYLADLERTRVGDFKRNKALTLEELEKKYLSTKNAPSF